MEPSLKKQKINDGQECALLGIKVTKQNSVSIGKENIWAPMLILFSTYFTALSSTNVITSSMIEEAKQKLETYNDLQDLILKQSGKEKKESGMLADLNIQSFWLTYLEDLKNELFDNLKLDHTNPKIAQILKMFYHGVLQLCCFIPEEGLSIINELSKKLDETLLGEDFWLYNPILLTQCHVWAHTFLDDIMEDHSRSLRRINIAHSFSLATVNHPFPELKILTEAQVCDQQLAIRLVRGEIGNSLNDNSDEEGEALYWTSNTFLSVPGAWTVIQNY
jgi:hypothetical protein